MAPAGKIAFWGGRGKCNTPRRARGFSLLAKGREADGGSCLLRGTFPQSSEFVPHSQAKAAVTAPPAGTCGSTPCTAWLTPLDNCNRSFTCETSVFYKSQAHFSLIVAVTPTAGEGCAGSRADQAVCRLWSLSVRDHTKVFALGSKDTWLGKRGSLSCIQDTAVARIFQHLK